VDERIRKHEMHEMSYALDSKRYILRPGGWTWDSSINPGALS
jgi:hypothetical protein